MSTLTNFWCATVTDLMLFRVLAKTRLVQVISRFEIEDENDKPVCFPLSASWTGWMTFAFPEFKLNVQKLKNVQT
ncbi:MAG: hypothetical protein EAZ78_23840 [Oscillatoriales cyanobacterium]|uniref:Uncharacterized protein n=1 Tax=Microcoleus anatoxicus PTRS2 TaxID=2705321 RepID=A0ABU8YNV9_9CYAN|nr:MAG: hypothetical protein EA000_25400 [Oscillatoriales cyanobacterium]TAD95944.1 MAG: hypothetical protein EAZ98_14100 [Oscillatoriales cyanobacterium]TAE98613.1 MAG: hypothetical protein EAZ78_23840 [Oscillatoriales cyanobacterium]TAF41637.1 MAG: hypothetical protein EAZ68_10375 [Oscillatoriales cyanobacterium]TAF69643.1 MAG: hypothetical protein EAZ59_07960 [Oscillatoriales cyanobacterium]